MFIKRINAFPSELKPSLEDTAKLNKWPSSGSKRGPRSRPYYSEKTATGANTSSRMTRSIHLLGDFEVLCSEVKEEPRPPTSVYVATLAAGRALNE